MQFLLKARAMENQAFVFGVNRVGNDGLDTAHSVRKSTFHSRVGCYIC
jgi:predicted amidohydrolase